MRSQLLHRGRSSLLMWQHQHLFQDLQNIWNRGHKLYEHLRCPQSSKACLNTQSHVNIYLKKALVVAFRQQPLSSENCKNQRWPNFKEGIPMMAAWFAIMAKGHLGLHFRTSPVPVGSNPAGQGLCLKACMG